MSATESKNFLHAAHAVSNTAGISGVLADMRCLDIPVRAGDPLFPMVPLCESAREHCGSSPRDRIRELSHTLAARDDVRHGIGACAIPGTAKRSFYGNQAVYRLASKLLTRKLGINIQPDASFKHAEASEAQYFALSCHASNVNPANCSADFDAVRGSRTDHLAEHAADYISTLQALGNSRIAKSHQAKFESKFNKIAIRRHCISSETSKQLLHGEFALGHERTTVAKIAHENLQLLRVTSTSAQDEKSSSVYSRTYVSNGALYWVCRPRKDAADPPKRARGRALPSTGGTTSASLAAPVPTLTRAVYRNQGRVGRRGAKLADGGLTSASHHLGSECYVLFDRDRRDLTELLGFFDQFCTFTRGRLLDVEDPDVAERYAEITQKLREAWLEVIDLAGSDVFLANNVGTLFDQVSWICLADLAGNRYFDHGDHMRRKAVRKVPGYARQVDSIVALMNQLPIDARIDLFGMNKMSIYPQVCAYETVNSQLGKHLDPHDCSFAEDTPLNLRRRIDRREMFVYMDYFYGRVYQSSYGYYPGRIKASAAAKPWHRAYKVRGVPPSQWREVTDVDISNTMPIPKPDFDSYLKLADSSCAPSDPDSYRTMHDYVTSPRYERRKLLYYLQSPTIIDIGKAHDEFCRVGDTIGDGDVSHHPVNVDFSVDISTGARYERQKPASRPFYQVCAPFGCLISNLELCVRTWLRKVPQSLMSMSLKDRGDSAVKINSVGVDIRSRFMVSDDKEAYSPSMDPESQHLTASFFSKVTGDSSFKSIINTLCSNELYYRVHDRLVHYPANGTDREGLRGAQNTWLEIVCHGYHTRMLREAGDYEGVTAFIGFIDDALRRYEKEAKTDGVTIARVRAIVADLEEKLIVVGRKLSWDKAYVSETLSTILGEVFYAGVPMMNGSKAFVGFQDVEKKIVEDLSSWEGNFASKCTGAKTAGAPDIACMYSYIHLTMKSHHKFGVRVGSGHPLTSIEYCLWCLTPVSYGGAGMRTSLELDSTETGSRTAAGIGNLSRVGLNLPTLYPVVNCVLNNELEVISNMDFLRDPTQVHVTGPRIRTQRVVQHVRRLLPSMATSPQMCRILKEAKESDEQLEKYVSEMRTYAKVDVKELTDYYAASAHSSIDSLVTKVCSSDTAKSLIPMSDINKLRRQVRNDAVRCAAAYRHRLIGEDIPI